MFHQLLSMKFKVYKVQIEENDFYLCAIFAVVVIVIVVVIIIVSAKKSK